MQQTEQWQQNGNGAERTVPPPSDGSEDDGPPATDPVGELSN